MSVASAFGRRRALWIATALGVVAVVFISVLATRGVPPTTVASSPLIGKTAPPIAGENLLTAKPVTLASLRGKFVFVNFFASWCAPCQDEAADLEAFEYAHHASGDATILGVLNGDSSGNATAFLRQTGATWPAVADPNAQIAIAYGVATPSQMFLIAPDGKVVAYKQGQVTENFLDAVLAPFGGTKT